MDTSFESVPITQLDKVPEGMVVIDASNPAPILVDQDGVRVSINAFSTSNSGTYFKVNFLLDNQSEQEVGVVLADVLINGYEMPVYQEDHGRPGQQGDLRLRLPRSGTWR